MIPPAFWLTLRITDGRQMTRPSPVADFANDTAVDGAAAVEQAAIKKT